MRLVFGNPLHSIKMDKAMADKPLSHRPMEADDRAAPEPAPGGAAMMGVMREQPGKVGVGTASSRAARAGYHGGSGSLLARRPRHIGFPCFRGAGNMKGGT